MPTINWSTILSRLQPSARQRVLDIRSRHEDLTRQLSELRAQLPKIDWAGFRAQLPGDKAQHVNELEEKARSFKPKVQDIAAAVLLVEQEKQQKVQARTILMP